MIIGDDHDSPDIGPRGGAVIVNGGYKYIRKPGHPRARGHWGYVGEHVLVAEKHAGRLLEDWEVVHHKDENKLNNAPGNLEILSRGEHKKRHAKPASLVKLECSHCGVIFTRRTSNYATKKAYGQVDFYCGRSCAGAAFGRGRRKSL